MKCFYTIDPKTLKKVFIPMCYGTMDTRDIRDCNCPDPLTEHQFQKERYNEVLQQKNESIESMQAEINHLNKVIINLKKNKFMNQTKAQEICKQAVELWGHEEQIKLWHEEVGELMHAISKHHRNPTADKLDHLCEETVDVKIMNDNAIRNNGTRRAN
jgi:predicted RNase H-like nuclease (RuvC/YqgF family)